MLKHFYFYLLLFTSLVQSQTKVNGEIKDEFGDPIAFANVFFKDSNEGTITNENGRFYLESNQTYTKVIFSFVGYTTLEFDLEKKTNFKMNIILKEESASLKEVLIFSGKQSKKNNPAIDILRKIWENKRENGVKKFDQYSYDKYEKLEFDINTIDSNLIKSRTFRGMEFIFDKVDTSRVTGNTYLPVFINEAYSKVYGDNKIVKEKELLEGNKNSGFENNQSLIELVKDLYSDFDIYDNHLKFFDVAFNSPISTNGINIYNYVLLDSAFIGDKWCYNIVYYPRRKNELTFKGDFWVNDSTWAIKEINLQASKSANLNWVREIYIEQEFDVLNDSTFLITRDYMLSDFSFMKKESALCMYGKRNTLFNNYKFDIPKDEKFYKENIDPYDYEVYNRSDNFWDERRMESLNSDEKGIYKMLDTLITVPRFKNLYTIGALVASGYYEFKGFDAGPIFSTLGNNDVEGLRLRLGGRTYFGQNDMWRLEGFGAYGFKDEKFKYGLSGKVLLSKKNRKILFGGYRKDIEQTGASLTNSNDVLGRNRASSGLVTIGANDRLTNIELFTLGYQMELAKNFIFRITGSHRTLKSASETFSLSYYDDFTFIIKDKLKQSELELGINYTPGRKTSGFGVERKIINGGDFPSFFLGYTFGLENVLKSDFDYHRIQTLYTQPWNIGGLGRLYTTIELGKIVGTVPVGLLSPIPGNQTLWSIYNTFTQLDYYEFVSDTYASFHLKHNFGGRFFGRVPLLRKLNLRELVGFRAVWGQISEENNAINVGVDGLPILYQSPEDIYWEWSAGVGNIFKIFSIQLNFRGNYLDNPGVRNFGITGEFSFSF
ncbi:MAG: DUF5686 family protein [Flavobacteriaceae bacterium]|nr:DUF5686 family protein [Flavobacteriaceae bacterium]